METKYNEVYVQNNDKQGLSQINPKYVYLTIPADYVCVYHKLLVVLSNIGKDIIDDCNAACKGNGKNVMNCWNLFQSAIACKELGKDKEAEFFINYIKAQLNHIYKYDNNRDYNVTFPTTIDNKGRIKAIVSCGADIKFEVDEENGILYEKWLSEEAEKASNGKVYTIEDNGNMKVEIK